jgi:FKBP-type peptidyl-prolyl cis-trans isomerase
MAALIAPVAACASKSAESPPPAAPVASTIPAVAGDTVAKSGMTYIDVRVGTGEIAERGRCVHTRYAGFLSNGTLFDFVLDTAPGGRPRDPHGFVIGRRQVIAGWEIGIEGMREGGYRRLFIPWRLAYGAAGSPPTIPPRSDLVFDVELVKVSPSRIGGTLSSPTQECGPFRR